VLALIPDNSRIIYESFLQSLDCKDNWEIVDLDVCKDVRVLGNFNTAMFDYSTPVLKNFDRNARFIYFFLLESKIYKAIMHDEKEFYIFAGDAWIKIDDDILFSSEILIDKNFEDTWDGVLVNG